MQVWGLGFGVSYSPQTDLEHHAASFKGTAVYKGNHGPCSGSMLVRGAREPEAPLPKPNEKPIYRVALKELTLRVQGPK